MTTVGLLEGYLSLTTSDGSCVELINSCRSLHYVANTGGPLRANDDCASCCCSHHDDDDYGDDPSDAGGAGDLSTAPWYDPNIAASVEFLGLIGSLSIASVAFNGRTRPRLTFNGILLSRCAEGRNYGNQWLQDQLTGSCGQCEGVEGTIFTHCGAGDAVSFADVDFANPRPDEDEQRACCDPSSPSVEPPILDEAPDIVDTGDTGQRQVVRLRYVRDSYQQVAIDGWVDCYGAQVTFSFDLESPYLYTDLISVCDLGVDTDQAGVETDVAVFDDCYCRPTEIDLSPLVEDCGRCVRSCTCTTTDLTRSSENTSAPYYTDPGTEACVTTIPMCSTRRSCVTPPLPFGDAVPVITIEAGPTPVDLVVTIWEAHPGLPDPQTCAGTDIYSGREPLVEPALVHIPAGTSMILDGRTGTADLLCDGRGPAGNLVATGAGTRFSLPTVQCSRRLWIVFDADCFNLPELGHRITVDMAGRFTA